MSFLKILDTLFLKPLQLLFEVVYMMADKVTGNPSLSIVVLSLFVNILVLPLYMRADAIQEKERETEKRLQKGVKHIKSTFSGDERMMMLQTYYRQNAYKPVYALRSATSLFLQIPFFIAAYRFLSGLQQLIGVSFGPIDNLGRPDMMLQIGGISLNVLPIVMTVVNLISCIIFMSDSTWKSKLQLYVMALFFLFFLYSSPSGLVLYWTLNNVFSLIKTIFYKLKNPKKALKVVCSVLGVMLAFYGVFIYDYQYNSYRRKAVMLGIGILLQMPFLYGWLKGRISYKKEEITANGKVFFSGALFLAVLTGALIPSMVIKSSPLEFVDTSCFYNPVWFIVSSFCMAFGMFVIWAGIFYFLAKKSIRGYFDRVIWMISGVMLVDYMFFGKDLGVLSSHLQYENGLQYTGKDILWNALAVCIVMTVFYILYKNKNRLAAEILMIGALAASIMAIINISNINNSVSEVKDLSQEEKEEVPDFTLSKTGKNVIVLMLDRAMGAYVPYIFREKPELAEKFSGFTYYPNMLSFGDYTNFSTPSLFGGYEYTPIEINKRNEESLVEKQNEALKVMPVLFSQNDYEVTVCDPPYAGYQWIPDLSIYDEYPQIKAYITKKKFTDNSFREQEIRNRERNLFCYSVFKTLPVCFQKIAYDQGRYLQSEIEIAYFQQVRDNPYTSIGIEEEFMAAYNVLEALPDITDPTEKDVNTFIMMENDLTHNPILLQEPDYLPKMIVDNREYKEGYQERFTGIGYSLKMEIDVQFTHYQTNMAAMIQLGEWFDYLREIGVYDNTRIILVSDHGSGLNLIDEFILEDGYDVEGNHALLMVKDFNSKGFETSEEFMTCADVPALATDGVIKNPINPFSGKKLDYGDKMENEQYVVVEGNFDTTENSGNQFLPEKWYAVHDDMRKVENWRLVAENAVLTEKE